MLFPAWLVDSAAWIPAFANTLRPPSVMQHRCSARFGTPHSVATPMGSRQTAQEWSADTN